MDARVEGWGCYWSLFKSHFIDTVGTRVEMERYWDDCIGAISDCMC